MEEYEAREHWKDDITMFSISEIKEATNNLDDSLRIGVGGFGTVYKGFLQHTTVAIKMYEHDRQAEDEFNIEMEILSKARHPNILALIGVCLEAHAVIFEYVPNGTLDAYLNNNNGTRALCWQTRIRIASEICSVLIFLHSIEPHGIAHADIKPDNILLDSNYSVKLRGFGISHWLYMGDTEDTPYFRTDNCFGQLGYMDPEFISTGLLTAQSDVYAFGIVLLQLVTGRNAIGIQDYARQAVESESLDSIIDSSADKWPFEEAEKLILLGLRCSHILPSERPDLATDVLKEIESLQTEKDRVDPVMKRLMISLDRETQRRVAIQNILDKERIEQKELKESKAALELQLVNSKALLETTRKQHEEIQTALQYKLVKSAKHKKNLEDMRIEQHNLLDSKAALECQVEQLQLQIQRDNALKNVIGSPHMRTENFTEFSWAELKQATNNFANSIGEGTFGSVFKGFLRHTNVAIKVLKSKSSEGDIEFNQEVEILTKVRHPNLVSLIGVNSKARALVFEFVPNSLDTFLTGGKNSELSWQDRIRIASELCSALIFLHSVPPYGIAHGDLKPQNILLDSNYVSKLCDFGISRRLYPTDETFTPIHLSVIPKFTTAYGAPEFFSSNEMTTLCDIYSFGIILLQLVTGRDPLGIKKFVGDLNNGKLDKLIVDSACNWPIKQAEELALLGLRCSHQLKDERPNLAKDVWPSIESMKYVVDHAK